MGVAASLPEHFYSLILLFLFISGAPEMKRKSKIKE